jgi:tetratricopeptide (TPR) repeat protein
LAAAACWLQAKDAASAADNLQHLVDTYDASSEALDGLVQLAVVAQGLQRTDQAISARDRLLRRAPSHPQAARMAAAQCAQSTALPEQLAVALKVLQQTTNDPQLIRFALKGLDDNGRYELALELAEVLLPVLLERLPEPLAADGTLETVGIPSTFEVLVEFLGEHREWSRLVAQADALQGRELYKRLSPSTQRWLIESLIERERVDAGLAWLSALAARAAEEGLQESFDLHARWAEVAIDRGTMDEARRSVQALTALVHGPGEAAMAEILQSQLEMRRSEFQFARERLQRLLAEKTTAAEIAARAQWLIGQSYQMQRDFQSAIVAYRRVPEWQDNGPWLCLALLEAGKCFEQLGQHREASTCYSSLVARFRDNPVVAIARDRLAQLPQPTTIR